MIEEAGFSRYHLLTLFEFKKQLIFLQERQVHTFIFFLSNETYDLKFEGLSTIQ